MNDVVEVDTKSGMEVFTFGEPVPVLDAREFFMTGEAYWNGQWYDTPISMDGIAKTYNANPFHAGALQVKRNLLVRNFIPHKLLSRAEFRKLVIDYLVFGNAYPENIVNMLGETIKIRSSLARFTRKTKNTFVFLHDWNKPHEFKEGAVFHLKNDDINQELYGVPDYLSGLQNVWLAESATLFRRRYYTNGGHAGFILYINDTAHNAKDVENIRDALKGTKGLGNFSNLMMYAPNGKKDGVQVIPLSEVQAKDEFRNIIDKTMQATIAMHRVPIQNFGAPPENVGGYGDVEKAQKVFVYNEIEPLQQDFEQINEWLGKEVVRFKPFEILENTAA